MHLFLHELLMLLQDLSFNFFLLLSLFKDLFALKYEEKSVDDTLKEYCKVDEELSLFSRLLFYDRELHVE